VEKIAREMVINNAEILMEFKIDFLRILCDYELFVPLNLPLPVTIDSIPDIMDTFARKHFLVGLLLRELAALINYKEKGLRVKVSQTLCSYQPTAVIR
jgi:hypothetical protein